MRQLDDTDPLPEIHRRTELAAIFASAILRLSQRCALTSSEVPEEMKTCLELPAETVLSDHHG